MNYGTKPWPKLHGTVCALDNLARYWWQSRHNLRDPPDLTDIPALARAIRA